jgi:polar amino acid transport system permease protein
VVAAQWRILGVSSLFELAGFVPPLIEGLGVTLVVTLGGAAVAALSAFAAGLAQRSRRWPVRALAMAYVDLFRGTSALVQLFWVFFALPMLGVELTPMATGILVLGLNIGAYGAEVVRGALQAVPPGQHEAALTLGFNERQILWRVLLPQALPTMLPTFGNLLIELLKGTALVSLITLADLTFQGQLLRASTLRSGEVFGLVLVLYFAVAQVLAYGVRWLERRVGRYRGPIQGCR